MSLHRMVELLLLWWKVYNLLFILSHSAMTAAALESTWPLVDQLRECWDTTVALDAEEWKKCKYAVSRCLSGAINRGAFTERDC